MNCPKCNEDIMSMSVHYCNPNQTNRTMNTPTPKNDQPTYAMLADMRDRALLAESELTAITEQRDRLAEALRQCREDSVQLLGDRDWWQYEIRLDYQKRYQETRDNVTRADEALQSLNQDHTVATNDMIAAVKGGTDEIPR